MKNLVSVFFLFASFSTFASTGTVHFIDWSQGDVNSPFYPSGGLVVSGQAAIDMNNALKNATLRPTTLDYSDLNLHGRDVSRSNVKALVGESYTCLELPKMNPNGSLKRDSKNKLSFYIQCDISIEDVSTGKIK